MEVKTYFGYYEVYEKESLTNRQALLNGDVIFSSDELDLDMVREDILYALYGIESAHYKIVFKQLNTI